MDLESLSIGVAVIASLLVPIIVFNLKQRQKAATMLRDLNAVAQRRGMQVSRHAFWNGLAIGLDAISNKVLYMGQQGEPLLIDLNMVTDCKLRYDYKEQHGSRIVELVALQFNFREKHLPEQELLFYSKESSLAFNQELVLAKEWQNLLAEQLKHKQAVASIVG